MSTEPLVPLPPESDATRPALYEPRSAFIAESSEEFDDIDLAEASALISEMRSEHLPHRDACSVFGIDRTPNGV